MIHFVGTSHAAQHLSEAAEKKGLALTGDIREADLIFVSEDTPTDADGQRLLYPIEALVTQALTYEVPVVLTSQVTPGFTRSFATSNIWHQAETLRIKDAKFRAEWPEQIIVGGPPILPDTYIRYLKAFGCPINFMSWESAEFAKIAINMFLAAQVDLTNELAEAAQKVGAEWEDVARVLRHDKRIGPHAYLEPGCWQDSTHLLRDYVTLEEIRSRSNLLRDYGTSEAVRSH